MGLLLGVLRTSRFDYPYAPHYLRHSYDLVLLDYLELVDRGISKWRIGREEHRAVTWAVKKPCVVGSPHVPSKSEQIFKK